MKLLNEILSFNRSSCYEEYKIINNSVVAYNHFKGNCYRIINTLLKLLSTLPIVATAAVFRHCEFLKRG